MEGPRTQRSVYSIEIQRGGQEGWHTQSISPDWVHAIHAADAAVHPRTQPARAEEFVVAPAERLTRAPRSEATRIRRWRSSPPGDHRVAPGAPSAGVLIRASAALCDRSAAAGLAVPEPRIGAQPFWCPPVRPAWSAPSWVRRAGRNRPSSVPSPLRQPTLSSAPTAGLPGRTPAWPPQDVPGAARAHRDQLEPEPEPELPAASFAARRYSALMR